MEDSHVLHFCLEMRFLGMYFVAGYVLRCNFHRAKAKYFGYLNILLGKLGSNPSENLVKSLVFFNFSQIPTYIDLRRVT